jgi:hypothetical protein
MWIICDRCVIEKCVCCLFEVGSWFISPVLAGGVSIGLFFICKFFILRKVEIFECYMPSCMLVQNLPICLDLIKYVICLGDIVIISLLFITLVSLRKMLDWLFVLFQQLFDVKWLLTIEMLRSKIYFILVIVNKVAFFVAWRAKCACIFFVIRVCTTCMYFWFWASFRTLDSYRIGWQPEFCV